ncbi:MAG: hypothetical protein JWM86_690 [Thermoleophilia bacterium]|nr:hypothetical protein [Thermoleophilia bacterium]
MTRERRLLRRILVAFAVVIALTPPAVLLGGAWVLLLVPALLAAGIALHAALGLRRLTRSARP